jgi:hypothetical protein
MKSTKILTIVFGIAIALVMISCKQVRYTYYLENATSYHIDSAKLNREQNFSLASGERIGPFYKVQKDNLASMFSQPLYSLHVFRVTQANSTYDIRSGTLHEIDALSDRGVYIFRIRQVEEDTTKLRFAFGIEAMPTGSARISKLP